MKRWRKYVGKRFTFFETEIDRRIVRVRVYLRPRREGNIIWYLATKTKGGHWSTTWLHLEDMEQLGFLFLILSKFCAETRYLNKKNFDKIQTFKKRWNRLVDTDFKDLKSKKILIRELMRKCGIQ